MAKCLPYATHTNHKQQLSPPLKPVDLPATLLTRQIVQCAKHRDWQDLLDLYERRKLDFNPIHFSTALHRLSRLQFPRRDPRFVWLLSDLQHRILRHHSFFVKTGVRHVANIIEACGRLQLRGNKTVRTIVQQVDQPDTAAWVLESGTPYDVASILHAAAILRMTCPNLIEQLDERIAPTSPTTPTSVFLQQAQPRDLAICVWACAKFQIRAQNILSAVLEHRCAWICEQGDPVDIARIAHASSKFRMPHILAPLEEYAQWVIDEGKPGDIAETAVAVATLKATKHTFWDVLEEKAEVFVQRSTPKPVSQIIAIMAKHHITNCPQLLEQIGTRSFVQRLLALNNPQPAAQCVWALGKMGHAPNYLFRAVDEKARWLVRHGSPRIISSCLWAFAKLGVQAPRLVEEIDQHFRHILGEPQAVANCVWSCAKLGTCAPNLFAALNQNPALFLEQAAPQALANTLWAYAKLGVRAPELFNQSAHYSTQLVEEGTTQNVANTVWACATLEERVPALFEALERKAEWMAMEGTPQELSNCVWACAKLNRKSPRLFSALNRQSHRLFQGCPQNVSQSIWACYYMKFRAPKLWSELEKNAASFARAASPQAAATVAQAAASLKVPSSNLFFSLNQNADRIISTGNSLGTATILMACAAKSFRGEALFAMLDHPGVVEEVFREGNTEHIAQVLFACATVGHMSTPLFQHIERNSAMLAKHATQEELSKVAWARGRLQVPTPQPILDVLPEK